MQAYPLAETARRARDLSEADRRALAEDLRAGLAVSLPLSTREKGTTRVSLTSPPNANMIVP